jgi:hypothetical protein
LISSAASFDGIQGVAALALAELETAIPRELRVGWRDGGTLARFLARGFVHMHGVDGADLVEQQQIFLVPHSGEFVGK